MVAVAVKNTYSPCCLVSKKKGARTDSMERIMRAQAQPLRGSNMSSHMSNKKTMEINPDKRLVRERLGGSVLGC